MSRYAFGKMALKSPKNLSWEKTKSMLREQDRGARRMGLFLKFKLSEVELS